MSNDLILMGVVIVLFGLYFTLQVELNKVRNQFTHYLLKPGSISKGTKREVPQRTRDGSDSPNSSRLSDRSSKCQTDL